MSKAKKVPGSEPLDNDERERYALLRSRGASIKDAGAKAGGTERSARRWELRADVKARRRFLKQRVANKVVKESVREIQQVTINRNDIIMGLAREARQCKSGGARVQAWNVLSEIFLLKAKNLKELRDFHGWTEEELQYFTDTGGKYPPRLRALLGESVADEEDQSASLRTEKTR